MSSGVENVCVFVQTFWGGGTTVGPHGVRGGFYRLKIGLEITISNFTSGLVLVPF